MKILVLNCGSSSIKYQFINMQDTTVLAEGIAERIGEDIALFTYKSAKYTKKKVEMLIENHTQGLQLILESLVDPQHGIIEGFNEIDAVGHRIVHGGENYCESAIVDDEAVRVIQECSAMAPLHNPAHLAGIYAVQANLPKVPQVVVFDTAFHQTMPPRAFLYPLPLDYYTVHKIRRYGFHGTSHAYVSQKAAEFLGKDIKHMKIITCHLGNGASVTAVENGKSIDTSMGFTPLEGLMMGTRCGDIDPAIVFHMMDNMHMTATDVNNTLNKKSGMLGLSHLSNDMRLIEEEVIEKHSPLATQALDVYCYRIKKYIGSYMAAMNGVDVIVFTGGVGERMPIMREWVCRDMENMGIILNKAENDLFTDEIQVLSQPESRITVLKIPTNEELMIALETQRLLS